MKNPYQIIDSFDLIGVPFAWAGRDHTKALDCYGLVKFMHEQNGVSLPDYATPSPKESKQFVQSSAADAIWKPSNDPIKLGNVIVFRTSRYLHVGYSLGDGNFVHTWEHSGGVCIEPILDWNRRIEGIYEFIGH